MSTARTPQDDKLRLKIDPDPEDLKEARSPAERVLALLDKDE